MSQIGEFDFSSANISEKRIVKIYIPSEGNCEANRQKVRTFVNTNEKSFAFKLLSSDITNCAIVSLAFLSDLSSNPGSVKATKNW